MPDMKSPNPETQALHYRIDNAQTHPVATPIYQNSAFSADSPYFYTRKSNPNCVELEGALALLEQCRHVISTTTGMSAISMVLNLLRPGDHLVINQLIYGCSYKLFQQFTAQFNIKLSIVDLTQAAWLDHIPNDVTMVLFETPTNPFLKTIPIQRVAEQVKQINPCALIVVDNTWATSLFQKPLQHDADISLASATKFISGHSDVMGGIIATDNDALAEQLLAIRFYHGCILDPHSAWLLRRSLHTLPLRMREHVRTTTALCEFLRTCPEVHRLYVPTTDASQLTNYGGIIFFEFSDALADRYRAFSQALTLFDTGTGMACVSSMVAQPWSGSHASMQAHEKSAMGLHQNLVRLCFGLEDVTDLITDIQQAFETIKHEKQHTKAVPLGA